MTHTMVADLTVDELRTLIKDVVAQTLWETFEDPDQGLELREEMEQEIRQSLAHTGTGGSVVPVEDVAARLGLEW